MSMNDDEEIIRVNIKNNNTYISIGIFQSVKFTMIFLLTQINFCFGKKLFLLLLNLNFQELAVYLNHC